MNLRDLETFLGIKYERDEEKKRVILPADRWRHVNEKVDSVGCTRLMIASRDGARECVNLLLRCGAEVNARDRHKRKAIDYSVVGNHPEATLMLLQWDSLLPYQMETETSGELKDVLFQNEDIRQFFTERDDFHKMLKYYNFESIKKYLGTFEGTYNATRYWVNSKGESPLYTAAKQGYYDSWALLRSSGFVCATEDEEEYVKLCENQDAFLRAIGGCFVEIRGCHVQKMVAKSKAYRREGAEEERCGEKVDAYYREIDAVEYTSDLLQCLQDDPSLEIIFDFSSSDVQCVRPLDVPVKEAWGLVDFKLNRMYVGAMETKDFDYSRVVSNIVHELTHKTLAVVFENDGLPYYKEDADAQEEYESVVKNLLSNQNNRIFDDIIRRALKSGNSIKHELIVRVPEMIAKYNILCAENRNVENGFVRLKREAPELLEFYVSRVVPDVKDYIQSNITANKTVKSDLLRTPALLTAYHNERIRVVDAIAKVRTSKQKALRVLKVSNLKLGVSHLRSSLEGVTFVDWTKYQSAREHLNTALDRNEMQTLVIVWDKQESPYFCHRSNSACSGNFKCIAKKIERIVDSTILIVPKKFNVRIREEKSFSYSWKDLSLGTKKWIMEKRLCFKGERTRVGDIVEVICGNIAAENMLDELLDEDDLSLLIDQENIKIGRPLDSLASVAGAEMLSHDTECYIPRSLRVRHLEFNQEVFYARTRDVFVVMNAEISDLLRDGIKEVCVWDGNNVPVDIRCFALSSHRHQKNIVDVFSEIITKLNDLASQETKVGDWDFVHFFEFKEKKYFHHNSLHRMVFQSLLKSYTHKDMFHYSGKNILECGEIDSALIISDNPGSGKSVYVKNTAVQMMRDNPRRWVEFVELQLFQNVFKEWIDSDFKSEEKEMDFLFEIIKAGGSERERNFERKLFSRFCKTRMKFTIFFDGLDEICPRYKEIFTSFLEAVVSRTWIKVCVTTRTHESSDLERRLKTISFGFRPFSTEDRVRYISMQWNALLNSIPIEERETKMKAIASRLESHNTLADRREILSQIQNLSTTEMGRASPNEIDFEALAAELLTVGKAMDEGEDDLTATPLHTWMLATVAFEENFNVNPYAYLPDLYTKFIEIKISLYCKEKAKMSGVVAADSLLAGFKLSVYESLKRYSVYFFLQDDDCQLNQDEVHHMLRVGLLAQRDQSTVFVHRTFGEYFLSTWLLENAHEERVTRLWVSRVLIENDFDKVRSFLNSLLLYEHWKQSAGGKTEMGVELGRRSLNPSALPEGEDFVMSMQRCVYRSVLECTEGILRYLAENSKTHLSEVLFGLAVWDVKSLDIKIGMRCKSTFWNAFVLCGECISGGAMMTKSNVVTHSEIEYLKFLPKMLRLVEERGMFANLKEFMSNRHLRWMGVNQHMVWLEKEAREQFKCIFEYIVRNKSVLGKTMKERLMDMRGQKLLVNSAIHAFDLFVFILESFFEELELKESLLKGRNLLRAWTCVVEKSGLEGVKKMWGFVEGKLKSNDEMKRFLRRKDYEERNVLLAAFLRPCDQNIISFVWRLFRGSFDEGESKELLLDIFNGVTVFFNQFTHVFFEWFYGILEDGFLDRDEATRLLLSEDRRGECYLLGFYTNPIPPPSLYKLQRLLLSGRLAPEDVLRELEGHCVWLARPCFDDSDCTSWDADFVSSVEREWEELVPSLESFPSWNAAVQLDEDGFLLHVWDLKGKRIHGDRLRAFVVLLERQCRLEGMALGREGVLERVKVQWFMIFTHFLKFRMGEEDEEGVVSEAFLVPLLFAALSKFIARERTAEVLLQHDEVFGTAFHYALRMNDATLFHALYDVARWSIGEDALWRVHCIGRKREGPAEGTLLELLLRRQD